MPSSGDRQSAESVSGPFADEFGQARIVGVCAGPAGQVGDQAANTLSRRY